MWSHSIPNLSGFSLLAGLFPAPLCVLALLSFLIAMTHEVFTKLLNNIGSLLWGGWLLVDGHHDGCKGKSSMKTCRSRCCVLASRDICQDDSPFSVFIQWSPLLFFLARNTLSVPERKMNLMPASVIPLAWKNSGDE